MQAIIELLVLIAPTKVVIEDVVKPSILGVLNED